MSSTAETPKRIVSLCPSLTEAIFDLGAGDRLVGVTDWCVHPKGLVEEKTRVGGTKAPDLETLYGLEPDLVVVNEEENRLEDVESIEKQGIPVHNTFPRTIEQTAETMMRLARRIGCSQAGEDLARDIREAKEEVEAEVSGKKPVRFICLIWRGPYMTVNADTYIHHLLTLAGGENLFADADQRYPKLTGEQLFTARPDVIFLPSEPYVFTAPHAAKIRDEAGLPPERVPLVDGEFLSWYGSRTPDGIRYAAKIVENIRTL